MDTVTYYIAVAACFSGVAQSVRCKRDPFIGEPPALRFFSNAAIAVGLVLVVFGLLRLRWWDPFAAFAVGGVGFSFLLGIRHPQAAIITALASCATGIAAAIYGFVFR